jgi:3-dehydroquinate synthase
MNISELIYTDNISNYIDESNSVLIIDKKVYSLFPEFNTFKKTLLFHSSEINKSFYSINKILNFFIENKLSRNSKVYAIGGGTLLDTVGFAASIYKRGINIINVPTTLLSMADASIGGKNAINFNNTKNIIGTFYLPIQVLINLNFLNTLENKHFKSGLLEIVKISLLFSKELFNFININQLKDIRNSKIIIEKIIKEAVHYKTKLVMEDYYDVGRRKLLNYGHTIAHSIELTRKIPHGIAVGYGMLLMQKYAENYYGANPELSITLIKLISKLRIKPFIFELSEIELDLVFQDKKLSNKEIDIVFLKDYEYPIIKRVSINELRNKIKNMS